MTQRNQQRTEVSQEPAAPQKWCRHSLTPATLVLVLLLTANNCTAPATPDDTHQVAHYTYYVVNSHPHDEHAFTQGLAYHDGYLYEGTGLRGRSELRQVELHTGSVLQSVPLSAQHFGEGITVCRNRIVQLTLDSRTGFVYDRENLRVIDEFEYETDGWGITCDGDHLIASDGSATLYFLNRDSYEIERYVTVHDQGVPLTGLNELEFIDGRVFANVWPTDSIAVIDPSDGRVTAWIDLTGLLDSHVSTSGADVLNGIAYAAEHDRLFVTGKFWPLLFEITLVER